MRKNSTSDYSKQASEPMRSQTINIFRLPCLVAGVLFFSLFAVAQENPSKSVFKPYLSLGLTSSQISGDNLGGFDQLGFNATLGTQIMVGGHWRPSIELQIDPRGSRRNAQPDKGLFESYKLRLNYVQVPLIMGYLQNKTGFELGLAPGYLLSSTEEDQNGSYPLQGREFDKLDIAGLAGIRYRFHERWELCTRFEQSLIKVRNHSGSSTFRLNQGQYSSAIQFMMRFHV